MKLSGILPALAVAALAALTSCHSETPAQKAVDILNNAADSVASCRSVKEAQEITNRADRAVKESGIDFTKLSPEEQQEVAGALSDLVNACIERQAELGQQNP